MQKTIRFLLASLAAIAGLVLLIPVVLMATPFWLVAALKDLGKLALERARPVTIPWQEMMAYESQVGWKPLGGINAWADGKPPFHVRTDQDGWRGPGVSIEDAEIIVFGDSFAFGQGADEERFFANLPGSPVIKAIGANGYNMVQGLLWMRRYSKRLHGKTVVWIVYYGNDLYENLRPNMGRYRIPFVRKASDSGEWEVVTEHVSADPWRFSTRVDYMQVLADICSPSFVSQRVFEAAGFLLEEAAQMCDEVGARLVLVGNPHVDMVDDEAREKLRLKAQRPESFDVRLADRLLRDLCTSLQIPFLALADHLGPTDHLPEDVHWSPAGHEKVRQLIVEYCARGPVEARSASGRRSELAGEVRVAAS